MILTKDEKLSGLDLEALSSIDEELVDVGGQTVIMTALVPADIEKARKLVSAGKLEEGYVMEYLTFLSMKKKHPEVTWYKFSQMNFRTVNKLMAVMAIQNGFNETFRAFGEFSDRGSGDSSGASGDPADGLDFE